MARRTRPRGTTRPRVRDDDGRGLRAAFARVAALGVARRNRVDEAIRESAGVVADLPGRQPGPGAINDLLPDFRGRAGGVHRLPEKARLGRKCRKVAGIDAPPRGLRALESDRGDRFGPTCVLYP